MAKFRISVATGDVRRGIKSAIPLAAVAGAEGVTFDFRQEVTSRDFGDTAIRQLQHLVSQHALQVAAGLFPLRLPLYEAEHADERIAAIQEAMTMARRFRTGTLVLPTGPIPESGSKDEVRLIESVNAIADAGNRTGTVPCLSFGRQPPERVLEVMQSIDAGPVLVDINPIDWLSRSSIESAQSKLRVSELSFGGASGQESSDTLEGLIRAVSQQIGHVQGRDGISTGRNSTSETSIGSGQVDWPLLLALLDEAAYAGWITVRHEGGGDAADAIAQSISYLRSLRDI